ncbi:uncharacterized protein K452DRAFT_306925 [Aplosporella prunicola CBS 121167]|uniref:Uncharacterized protein n=1 Tax=Aplosporella prunicola CBS 121167 TaxID=1176127 RepID=A0A6A6BJZ6_9PEZI|nr:uncharacterized protein K452DRAFT_306925 [Aplosporella prunicola CBS 121167]KAF2144346.1 hypothetical protein K452DRAFT_306925 [Aplosporella prunicola CBS 121167]
MSALIFDRLGALDDQTVTTILQFQLEDVNERAHGLKGKGVEGTVSDADYALELYRQEIGESIQYLNDRTMGRSIANAVQSDRHLLGEVSREEEIAIHDRELALKLNGDEDAEEPLLATLAALYISEDVGTEIYIEDEDELVGDSSSGRRKGKGRAETTLNQFYEIYREDKKFFDITRNPYGHHCCRDCIDQLFQASITDETLFPLRYCGQPIPPYSIRMYLTADTLRDFKRKREELETHNRTYYAVPRYSAFIPPKDIQGEVACTHAGDCLNDEALQQLLETAETNS